MRAVWIALVMTGCVRQVTNRLTTQGVVPVGSQVRDVDRICQTGAALGYPLAAVSSKAHRAAVIADATAGLCDERAANDLRLEVARAQYEGNPEAVRDLREQERRVRARAAGRFHRAWGHANTAFGPLGEGCSKIAERDELTYLVGLLAGTLAMLHDKASGSTHDVPLDTVNRAGRAATCVEGWWSLPDAFEAAAWAAVPGTAPEGEDPWARLRTAAEAGEAKGMRLGLALLGVLADNAGREEDVEYAIDRAAAMDRATSPAYELFDQYALDLLQDLADERWIMTQGHRMQGLSLPAEPVDETPPSSLIDDPFASDEPADAADPFASEEELPPDEAPTTPEDLSEDAP